MQTTDPATLALHDIHLPDSVSWWPLAPGWWILLLLIIITIASVIFLVRYRRNHQISAVRLAKMELVRIENEFKSNKDKSILIQEISKLIRRVSISLFKRDESASLTGQDWLLFLDQLNGDNSFSNGIGRVLIEAPYQAKADYDAIALLNLTSSWIDSVDKNNVNRKRNKK
jgi:uncharacterized protein DUF4381